MHLLIDGDILPYSIGFAFNKDTDDLRVATIALNRQLNYIQEYIDQRFKSANGSQIKKTTIYLSNDDVKNFRYDVAKTLPYKGNRVDTEKPRFYKELKQELINKKNSVVVTGIEADDAMGIAAMEKPEKSIIVSKDKDMRMIPGWKWEMSEDRHPFFVTERGYVSLERRSGYVQIFGTGEMWLMAQMLMGDKADNIPGLKGFGPKKAHDWLTSQMYPTMDDVQLLYKKMGCINRFNEVKELLWILQKSRETKETNGVQRGVPLK